MDIQQAAVTLIINGVTYTFDSPHPIEDLLNQYNGTAGEIEMLTKRLAATQEQLTDAQARQATVQAQITDLCAGHQQ